MMQGPQTDGAADPFPSTPRLAFEGGTAYLLSRAGAAARRSWARMLTERGLTTHHYGVLMALAELGPTGQQQLCEVIGIDQRNAVPVIDVLVERDLLVRDTDPADRRRRVLVLAPAGQEVVIDLTATGDALERDFLRALDATQQQQLHLMLVALLSGGDKLDNR
ncbi:MAG: MarR family winged helix-turn-helix transcriptional regulator [Actinomycetota bacterium]|nr:MarR family winged helix-turn-helix transcriptional regulator [Actinomycetota bacterium]